MKREKALYECALAVENDEALKSDLAAWDIMPNNSVKPEDILPDGVDTSLMAGRIVRKGTIAAFLANIDILENPTMTGKQKQDAIQTMKELAPSVIAIGLHKHVRFNNSQAEKILLEAAK